MKIDGCCHCGQITFEAEVDPNAMLAADWQFLVTAGAPWTLAFSAGILDQSFPYFTLLGLTGTAILCAVPSGAAAASEPPSSPPSSIAVSSAARIPVRTLLVLALVPAAIAFKLGMSDEVSFWLAVATMSVTMFLPTLALYFAVLLGLYLAVTRRDATSSGILVLALLPFADWGYAQWSTARAHEQEAREITAIPTTPVATIPATLVWQSSGGLGVNAVWTIAAIQRVIEKKYALAQPAGGRAPARSQAFPLHQANARSIVAGRISTFQAWPRERLRQKIADLLCRRRPVRAALCACGARRPGRRVVPRVQPASLGDAALDAVGMVSRTEHHDRRGDRRQRRCLSCKRIAVLGLKGTPEQA